MQKTYNIEPVKQAFQNAKTVLIILPQNPHIDSVAASLALYLSLIKKQLAVTIGCATPMTVKFNRLFAVDKIRQQIGNQNLVISFDYPEDSVEKVSYDKDLETKKIYLTIEPKIGCQPPNTDVVNYSYTGSSADVIFIIGAKSLEDLGPLYFQEKGLLEDQNKTLVNLSHVDNNTQFGTVNIYDPTVSGCCEIMTSFLQTLSLPVDAEISTNLLAGIENSTDNYSSANVTADTFEIAAQLIRSGGKKGYLPKISPTPSPVVKPIVTFQTPPPSNQTPIQQRDTSLQPSPDWLKPKVYKSSDAQG